MNGTVKVKKEPEEKLPWFAGPFLCIMDYTHDIKAVGTRSEYADLRRDLLTVLFRKPDQLEEALTAATTKGPAGTELSPKTASGLRSDS